MTGPARFHAKDRWSFQREDDGSVRLFAPDSMGPGASQVVVLAPETWASAVASVSHRGEMADSYASALTFHMGAKDTPREAALGA